MKNTKSCPNCTTLLIDTQIHCHICEWSSIPQTNVHIVNALPIFLPMSGGNFMMGSSTDEVGRDPDEKEHPRTIDAFWIANVEVTQQLYVSVTKHNPSIDKHPLKPISSVTWWEAILFCNQLSRSLGYDVVYDDLDTGIPVAHHHRNGFRLPTEAEWEWMAKHQKPEIPPHQAKTDWSTRPTRPQSSQLQWVLGNVWEMCWDLYTPYPNDPNLFLESIPPMARIVRGGSWVDSADIFRPANRAFVDPNNRTDTIGFRLARSSPIGLHSINRI